MASPQAALAQILKQINSPVSAAYLHGLWCGRIVAGDGAAIVVSALDENATQTFSSLDPARLAETEWWQHTDAVLDSDEPVDGPYIKALALIYGYAEEALASDALDFELWLTSETDLLQIRLEDLADWAQGFLEGFAALLGERMLDIGDDASELIQDLIAIGELDALSADDPADADDAGKSVNAVNNDGTSSGAEFEFLQIEEFVKTAVLHFWHDFRTGVSGTGDVAQVPGDTATGQAGGTEAPDAPTGAKKGKGGHTVH